MRVKDWSPAWSKRSFSLIHSKSRSLFPCGEEHIMMIDDLSQSGQKISGPSLPEIPATVWRWRAATRHMFRATSVRLPLSRIIWARPVTHLEPFAGAPHSILTVTRPWGGASQSCWCTLGLSLVWPYSPAAEAVMSTLEWDAPYEHSNKDWSSLTTDSASYRTNTVNVSFVNREIKIVRWSVSEPVKRLLLTDDTGHKL